MDPMAFDPAIDNATDSAAPATPLYVDDAPNGEIPQALLPPAAEVAVETAAIASTLTADASGLSNY